MANSNPIKHFNDAFDKRKAGLRKAQAGEQSQAEDIISRYEAMNKDTVNNKGKERPWTGTSTLNEQYGNPQINAKERLLREVKKRYIDEITNSAKTKESKALYPRPKFIDPKFIDPSTDGIIKKEKSGGQTKSKKKK